MNNVMDKKQLDFILIDGKYYGGSQYWASGMMNLGGCSTVVTCEACMYLAREFPKMKGLYPYGTDHFSMEDFMSFFRRMFKYVYPGIGGLASIEKYTRMFRDYIGTTDVDVRLKGLEGTESYEQAEAFVRAAIDGKTPVMYLMLKHRAMEFSDYEWHWFLLTGYEAGGDKFYVDFASWGRKHRIELHRAWDTGKAKRGGLVCAEPVQ